METYQTERSKSVRPAKGAKERGGSLVYDALSAMICKNSVQPSIKEIGDSVSLSGGI